MKEDINPNKVLTDLSLIVWMMLWIAIALVCAGILLILYLCSAISLWWLPIVVLFALPNIGLIIWLILCLVY